MSVDRFGNPIDPIIGYARGRILGDDASFRRRAARARQLIRQRAAGGGRFHILTGNRADFPLAAEDRGLVVDGWVGPALWEGELAERVRDHLGASARHEIEIFNRTSAGIVAAISALAQPADDIVSLVPAGRAHPCVRRGALLAGARLLEGPSLEALAPELGDRRPSLAVITPLTSELDAFDNSALAALVAACRVSGIPTLLDDAYGARVRPHLADGPRSLELGVDLAITNNDKAGLYGPRAGLLAGQASLVERVAARGLELALEAREPIRLAVLRALERYGPETLLADAAGGQALGEAVVRLLGPARVRRTLLGPSISEEDLLELLLERAGLTPPETMIVPAEAVAAVAMLLLQEHGVVTVNVLNEPGSRPSLRLKPTADALDALGGPDALAGQLDAAIARAATLVDDEARFRSLVIG